MSRSRRRLEHRLAQATADTVNATVLAEPTDAPLRAGEVRATDFPRHSIRALEHYFPEIPLDHPLTELFLTGAQLAGTIEQKKNAREAPDA